MRWRLTGLDEDLHSTAQAQHKVQCRLLLDIVVGERTAILELLAGEDQALLVRRDALLVLDLGLDIVDGIGGLDLKGDGLAGDCGLLATAARLGGDEATYGSLRRSAWCWCVGVCCRRCVVCMPWVGVR